MNTHTLPKIREHQLASVQPIVANSEKLIDAAYYFSEYLEEQGLHPEAKVKCREDVHRYPVLKLAFPTEIEADKACLLLALRYNDIYGVNEVSDVNFMLVAPEIGYEQRPTLWFNRGQNEVLDFALKFDPLSDRAPSPSPVLKNAARALALA